MIPPDIGEFGLRQLEKKSKGTSEWKKFLATNPTEAQKLEFLKNTHLLSSSLQEMEKEVALIDFILKNKEYLLKVIEQGDKEKKVSSISSLC